MDIIDYLLDRITGKAPKGARRHHDWKRVRALHLKKFPRCMVCHGIKKIQVHHIIPFYVAPGPASDGGLELSPENLLTLCTRKKYGINCHLLVGHLGNFRRFNPAVQIDAYEWNIKIKGGTD